VEAYAACGGYPLHLGQWDQARSVEENLARLAFSPSGILVGDALDILSEDLDWRGGYERVLAAIGGGARRRSRIAGRAQRRIDYTLNRLQRAGYVRLVRPVGAIAADPLYEIGDDYLAFWFDVLREDADLISGCQGAAVRRRSFTRWQRHLGRVYESLAREHAVDLVRRGHLPAEMIVGRWWQDKVAEVDVLGLIEHRTGLVGECRWQEAGPSQRDLIELRRKVAYVPESADGMRFIFWTRTGGPPPAGTGSEFTVFGASDAVDGLSAGAGGCRDAVRSPGTVLMAEVRRIVAYATTR
jgi:hypothetical protein